MARQVGNFYWYVRLLCESKTKKARGYQQKMKIVFLVERDGKKRSVTDRCGVGFWPQGACRSPLLPELAQIAFLVLVVLSLVVLGVARVGFFGRGAFGLVQAAVDPSGGDSTVIRE